jgi:hypothetical protein
MESQPEEKKRSIRQVFTTLRRKFTFSFRVKSDKKFDHEAMGILDVSSEFGSQVLAPNK